MTYRIPLFLVYRDTYYVTPCILSSKMAPSHIHVFSFTGNHSVLIKLFSYALAQCLMCLFIILYHKRQGKRIRQVKHYSIQTTRIFGAQLPFYSFRETNLRTAVTPKWTYFVLFCLVCLEAPTQDSLNIFRVTSNFLVTVDTFRTFYGQCIVWCTCNFCMDTQKTPLVDAKRT